MGKSCKRADPTYEVREHFAEAVELISSHQNLKDLLTFTHEHPHHESPSDPDIWQECESGNFCVNKNVIPLCGFGPDHAVEHLNRWMKVSGGIERITLNESARARFFLIAPEMARLAEKVSNMAGISSSGKTTYHHLSETYMQRQEKAIETLRETINSCQNPFKSEGKDMLNYDKIGDLTCKNFVKGRIVRAEVNLWSPLKKLNLKTWKSAQNMVWHQLEDKIVELKEDTLLFARLLLVARSRPEINLQEAIGRYVFSHWHVPCLL